MQVILYDKDQGGWLRFNEPVEVIQVWNVADVIDRLQYLETAVAQRGLYAAGFLTYEAASAFDDALVTQAPGSLPLMTFGLFESPEQVAPVVAGAGGFTLGAWVPSISRTAYDDALDTVKAHIAEGDTYQVNFTLRLHASFSGNPYLLFADLVEGQAADYAAFVDIGSHAICSVSPELFFTLKEETLTSKPMKGTAPRGMRLLEDRSLAEQLAVSPKNRAENVMIVDMIRNDMGRVADAGTVRVAELFALERYPYVWQMTSTVKSTVRQRSLVEILQALFPCASITGAPKVRTMQLIRDLECSPRGVYTGTIGYLAPQGHAQFNVAIRTITVDRQTEMAEYGVGGGIVWDSETEDEYRECLAKAQVLYRKQKPFNLLESLLWEAESGFFLLEEHLQRLQDSAEYFGRVVDLAAIRCRLDEAVASQALSAVKIRVQVDQNNQIIVESHPLDGVKSKDLYISLDHEPVNSNNPFLYHKTTQRGVYQAASDRNPGVDDVLLWNERGEITESCRANVVVRIGDTYLTPPCSCGLLAGTFRDHLLRTGCITEGVIAVEMINNVQELFLINSVRRWMKVSLV